MDNTIFVGRESTISNAVDFLEGVLTATVSQPPRFLIIQGAGGIGKTKTLSKIRERLLGETKLGVTQIVDLKVTSNRSTISLMQNILSTISVYQSSESSVGLLHTFLESVKDYNVAREQEKYSLYEATIETFIRCCIETSIAQPFVVLLDTFESVQDFELSGWLLKILGRIGGRIGVAIAGRLPIPIHDVQILPILLEGLSAPEINDLGFRLFEKRGIAEDYDLSSDVIQSILHLTDGRPILVVLAFEWILENVQPEVIVSIPKQSFEREIVQYLRYLQKDEDVLVIMMATLDRRLTPHIMSLVTQWSLERCQELCSNLSRFSFVKTIEQSENKDLILTLHDEMLRLVANYADFPSETKQKWRENIVNLFYEQSILEATDPQGRQTLIAEMLHYQLRYDLDAAIQLFDTQLSIAVVNYEFEFCNLLFTEVNNREINLNERQRNIIDLDYAELLVKAYKPFEAKNMLDRLLTSFDAETETGYFSRVISAYGACIANGATLVEANVNDAINLLQKNLKTCEAKGLTDRVANILFELGNCYDILGYNDKTLDFFQQSNQLAREIKDVQLITRTLDEMGKLRLRRYEVASALALFQESLKIKEDHSDSKGLGASYHYVGNAFRDLDNFPEALKWYDLAEKARLQVADDLGLCELYSDITWLYLLEKNWETAIAYLNKCYYEYAIPRHFGREIADAEHSFYHIKLDLEGLDAALPWIEKSFANAEKYSNTFIYLDAALHLIEAAYEKKEFGKIPAYYQKMKDLDDQGCGYRAFKGRAANVLGDIAFDHENYSQALDYWIEGYTIIAIHGRSRSSIKRFDDHLYERIEKLRVTLLNVEVNRIMDLLRIWASTELELESDISLYQEYPAMSGIFRLGIGDHFYRVKEYEKALQSWYTGLVDIIVHLVKKQTSNVLGLDDFVTPRQADIVTARDNNSEEIGSLGVVEHDPTWLFSQAELRRFGELLAQIQKQLPHLISP